MRSRVDQIAKNVKFALISQVLLVSASFVLRRVFVSVLGQEYLGLNGLFSDILSMLSLAELGFGTSIVFSLYEPMARNDIEKIKSLMALYKRAYYIVGTSVILAGSLLAPYLNLFVKEMPENIPNIELIYILNVFNTGISYFFIYKASILFVDQKKYVETVIHTSAKLVSYVLEIVVLIKTGNYYLYLGISILETLVQNMVVSWQVDRMYPYIRDRDVMPLKTSDKNVIKRNVGAMVFHKLGSVVVFSTDNILMAKLVSISAVGIYSNYIMIRRVLETVINLVYTPLAASIGNLNASESAEKKYQAFIRINFFSAWVFGFGCICLACLYNPFISLWLGKDYLLPSHTVLIIVVNFYFFCMRVPIGRTKEAMGLFWMDRYKPIPEILINLAVSIWLGRAMGLDGILWGTFISTLLVPFWIEPFVVYRYGLDRPVMDYFIKYILYGGVTMITGLLTLHICKPLSDDLIGFLQRMLVCIFVPNMCYLIVWHKSPEFMYMYKAILRSIGLGSKGP